jgi:hypothetical protein
MLKPEKNCKNVAKTRWIGENKKECGKAKNKNILVKTIN